MTTTTQKTIETGAVVKRNSETGYYRVTSIRGGKANLGSVFGRCIYHKGVPVETLTECENEWYAKWQQSETYQCM